MACSLVALTYRFGTLIIPFYLLLPLVGEAQWVLRRYVIAPAITNAL
jgi:hypothetical protein